MQGPTGVRCIPGVGGRGADQSDEDIASSVDLEEGRAEDESFEGTPDRIAVVEGGSGEYDATTLILVDINAVRPS